MQNHKLQEICIESQLIFSGNFIRVYRDRVRLPDGNIALREYVKHSGSSAILALDENMNLIVERQYRHPVNQIIYEIPAGKLDFNESELECAKRELLEETGYSAKEWTYLGECLPCVGYSNERIVYFLAQNLSLGTQKLDAGEFLEVVCEPLGQILNKARAGQISDSKTLSGLILLQGYLCLA